MWLIPNVKANHVEKTDHPCQFLVELVDSRNGICLSRCCARQDVQDQTRDGESGRERCRGSIGDSSRALDRTSQPMSRRMAQGPAEAAAFFDRIIDRSYFPSGHRYPPLNKSLDASRDSAFLNMLYSTVGATACPASTPPLGATWIDKLRCGSFLNRGELQCDF